MRRVVVIIASLLFLVAGGQFAMAEGTESSAEGGTNADLQGQDSLWTVSSEGTTCVDDFAEDGFNIEEAELNVGPGFTDAYDDAFIIYVDGVPYFAPGYSTGGNGAIGDPVNLSGVEVVSTYQAFSDSNVLRQLTTFGNFGAGPVTVTVGWGHDRGSDDDTVEEATSDGDTIVEAGDRWVVSSEGVSADPDPRLAFVTAGVDDPATESSPQGASALAPLCQSPEDLGFLYELTVPAGANCALLHFGELSPGDVEEPPGSPADTTDTTLAPAEPAEEATGETILTASDSAEALSQTTGSSALVSDIDPAVRSSVVNFDLGERADGPCSEPDVLPDDDTPEPVPATPPFTG